MMSTTTGSTTRPYSFPREYSFPPFYTLQPNESTRHAQLAKWSAVVLGYCAHHRIWKLSLSEAVIERPPGTYPSPTSSSNNNTSGTGTATTLPHRPPPRDLFHNQRLDRRLSLEAARQIMSFMAREGTAQAFGDKAERSMLASLGLLGTALSSPSSSSSAPTPATANSTTATLGVATGSNSSVGAMGATGISSTSSTSATGAGAANGGQDVWWIWWRPVQEWANLLDGWIEETGQRGGVLTVWEITHGDVARGTEFFGMDGEVLRRVLATLVKRGKAQVFGEGDGLGVKFF